MAGDFSHHEMADDSTYKFSQDRPEEVKLPGASWYLGRKDIEENFPSRRDGIDLKKETYLRKSYCTFLQDLGMRLKVPQVTIATAIVFCHRFFLRQSHARNDRRTVATVCMFLAGKVEESPRPLKDVILVSYEIIHKKDPTAVQRIKQREVYEQQKELILIGERLVLATLGFDLNVLHPYKPLVEAIKKFKIAQNALAQVAWNFVNDGLRTSLCLQFKPHHIAAGAIFLAAKFLKVKLPSDGDKVWWQEFDVTPRQLEEISNQMLELYEQNRPAPASQGNETEGMINTAMESGCPANAPTHSEQFHFNKHVGSHDGNDHGRHELQTGVSGNKVVGAKDAWHHEPVNDPDTLGSRPSRSEPTAEEYGVPPSNRIFAQSQASKVQSPAMDAIKKIDKEKVKAALEKRKRSRPEFARKPDHMDEEDLIERELEHGIELAVEDERNKQKSHNWSKPSNNIDLMENAEEGELSVDSQDGQLPEPSSKRMKTTSLRRPNGIDDLRPPGRKVHAGKPSIIEE
ncbi:hypothetical protein ZIOFF_030145 [Zingiber officinale]|uniref:Cyclin-like domain-containing protein n=1 Tax=Zingiber officinale TaxID=94328 RepID=A0A8J5LEZ3_ZINOF|nr:hypothetical protein ZIOFF_030145 [Zingiber officinale]